MAACKVGGDMFSERFAFLRCEAIERAEWGNLAFFEIDVYVVRPVRWEFIELVL